MLAYNGLALITEKLQNQRLEEPPGGSTAPPPPHHPQQPGPGSAGTLATSGFATRLPMTAAEPTAKVPSAPRNNLAVKGKNVWASSLESERPGRRECSTPEMKPHPRLGEKSQASSSSATTIPHSAVVCRHRKLRQSCPLCEPLVPGTPTAPPKKKHCRSLSVPPPPDMSLLSMTSAYTSSSSSSKEPKLWRPIAVIPLGSSPASSGSPHEDAMLLPPLPLTRDRDSSEFPHLPPPPQPEVAGYPLCWLPSRRRSPIPLVPSPPSVDSGHCTTVSSSDLVHTPPGSPLPQRPASAASDSSCLSSLVGSSTTAWHEFSPLQHRLAGGFGGVLGGSGHAGLTRPPPRVLETRSLSLEDRISSGASSSSASSISNPCLRCRSSSSNDEIATAMACGLGIPGGEPGGPGQGQDGRIPRCHSQPCVLHHRRCGKKRRRDCDRPTLNFNKMTETAYSSHSHRRSEPWNTPYGENQLWPPSGDLMAMGLPSSRIAGHLNTIASSPLDSSDHLAAVAAQQAARLSFTPHGLPLGSDLSQAASIALPLTPPDQKSPNFFATGRRRAEDEDEEEVEDEEEEEGVETDHTDCSCHDGQEDDPGLFPLTDLDLEQIEND